MVNFNKIDKKKLQTLALVTLLSLQHAMAASEADVAIGRIKLLIIGIVSSIAILLIIKVGGMAMLKFSANKSEEAFQWIMCIVAMIIVWIICVKYADTLASYMA